MNGLNILKKKRIRKILGYSLGSIILIYLSICTYMYFMQESFIFHPEKIEQNQVIDMGIPSQELTFKMDEIKLHGVLCKVPNSRGLIFFLHGNKGNVLYQRKAAKFYTSLGYDFFTFDYRGFGKSNGECINEEQFFNDVKHVYKEMAKLYPEKTINVIGYSLGTGPAAMLASQLNPSRLLLIAPYYSLKDMTIRRYYIIPTFLLKYPFETNVYLQGVKIPTLIVHGDQDAVLPYEGGEKLAELLNNSGRFVRLAGQGHDDLEENAEFRKAVSLFLN